MITVDKGIPVPHSPGKGKRNPIWEEVAAKVAATKGDESVYVPRAMVSIGKPKNMAVAVYRYLTEYGGKGWYTAAIEGDGIRIWKIKEPQKD